MSFYKHERNCRNRKSPFSTTSVITVSSKGHQWVIYQWVKVIENLDIHMMSKDHSTDYFLVTKGKWYLYSGVTWGLK